MKKEERLEIDIFENSESGIGITDKENKFIYVNNAVCNLFEYTKEEFLKGEIKVNDLFPKIYLKNPAEKEFIPLTEYEMVTKNGEFINVAVSSSRIANSELKLLVFQDMSLINKAKRMGMLEIINYAKKNIGIIHYAFENTGPELIAKVDTENYPEEVIRALQSMGLYYMTAIQNKKGLFGPLPVPVKGEDYLAIVYSYEIETKEEIDKRFKQKKPCIITLVFPKVIESLLSNRRYIRETISEVIKENYHRTTDIQSIKNSLRKIKTNLFENIEKQKEENTFERKVLQINQFITSFGDVKINEQLYARILKIAKKICDFKRISILLMDYQVNGLRVVEASGYEKNIIDMIIDIDAKSIVARAARTRQTQNIQNVQKDKDYIMVDPSVLAELAVPVISPVNDKTVGVINIESEMEKAFNQEDVILFEMLAEKIALVLAIEETETKYLSLLNVLSFIAETEELKYKELIGRIGEFLKKTLGIKCAALFMTEEENKKILKMEGITGYEEIPEELKKVNIEDEKGVVEKCAREKKALNIGNVKEIDYYLGINEKIKSEIAIPIIKEGELIGVINAKSERENAFTKTDEKLFFIIAELISFAKVIMDLKEKIKKNRNEEKV